MPSLSKPFQLSIIIVNWNTGQLTAECIRSIQRFTLSINYEIIVVDNCSSDGSQAVLGAMSGVRLIANEENVGFAKANNIGLRSAVGKYFLLLNSDTIIRDDAIGQCLLYLQQHDTVGMVGCTLLNSDLTLQRSCARFPSLLTPLLGREIFSRPISRILPHIVRFSYAYSAEEHFDELQPDWIMGAFMMVRREAVISAGMLDEDYFMYWEDMDWCYRIRRSGWSIGFLADVAIIHLGGASSNQALGIQTVRRHLTGTFLFVKKHYGRKMWIFVSAHFASLLLELAIRSMVGLLDPSSKRKELQNCWSTLLVYQDTLRRVRSTHLVSFPVLRPRIESVPELKS